MPSDMIKTKKDEQLWKRASSVAKDQYDDVKEGSEGYHRIVNGIFQRMKGAVKEGEASSVLKRSEFTKMAEDIVRDFFQSDGKRTLDDQIVKVALMEDLNPNQVQTLASSTNHLMHAITMREKKADPDKYIEYDIARPEKIGETISFLTDIPDDVYLNAASLFNEKQAEEDPRQTEAQHHKTLIRRSEILRQNISTIADTYNKTAEEMEAEGIKANSSINKLYNLVKDAILSGADPLKMKAILAKAFSGADNLELVWNDILTNLMAENIIKMPPMPEDRTDPDYSDSWAPNANNPVISMAMDIDRRLNKSDELGRRLEGLQKLAAEAAADLKENEIEKLALAAILGRAGTILKKHGPKILKKATGQGAKVLPVDEKKKGIGELIGGGLNMAFIGSEVANGAGKAKYKVRR